jgi:hypothetical protein
VIIGVIIHTANHYLIALVLHSSASFLRANSLSSWQGPSRAKRISSVNCLRRCKKEKSSNEEPQGLFQTMHRKAIKPPSYRTLSIHFLSCSLSWLGNAPAFGGKMVVLLPARRLGDLAARCWLTRDA